MPDFFLTTTPFLDGFTSDYDGTILSEITDLSLVSIAQPLAARAGLKTAVKTAWGCDLPAPGRWLTGDDGRLRLMCTGPDGFMVLMPANSSPAVLGVTSALSGAGYCCDQSDNWVILRLSGPLAVAALERICPVDIHPAALAAGSFARTVMEHLGAIVMREADDTFLLLSASSSARSFLQAIETSLKYVS
ncbi:sarcosine oxidase subunit gamma [Rhodobacteraceae bacterium R_SAG10]|nr:sarcosine oxidase subunit gamma [Rhodobacteraceae bacterium R_SAG10]